MFRRDTTMGLLTIGLLVWLIGSPKMAPGAKPEINPTVDEISLHPTNMPREPIYTLYENGEFKNPVENRDGPINIEVHFQLREVVAEIVEGSTRELWTFNGNIPGPMIRAKVGDTLNFYLHNPKDNRLPHNVDFHAVTGPGGGSVKLDTLPGETSQLKAKLIKPGIYIYHCAFPPIPSHIEHGMHGLLVVEPEEGLPEVDHEYYMMQSELYTGQGGDQLAASLKNEGRLKASGKHGNLEEPSFVTFNGRPKALQGQRALGKYDTEITTGETLRLFVGNIGPNFISSFHVIGEMFDTVYVRGSFDLINENVQTTLIPAGGAVGVEMKLEVPGNYTPVDHAIYRINKGAIGTIHVKGDKNKDVYNPITHSDVR